MVGEGGARVASGGGWGAAETKEPTEALGATALLLGLTVGHLIPQLGRSDALEQDLLRRGQRLAQLGVRDALRLAQPLERATSQGELLV